MPASPKVFSPVLFLPPSETAGFSRKRQIRRVWFPAAGRPLSTSKQRDSLLSYALHFLRQNIPPNVLRSGKAARKESSVRLPWEKCKKSREKNARAAKRLKLQQGKMQNIWGLQSSRRAFITGAGGFDGLFILVKRLGPSVTSWSCELWPWTWPDPTTKEHKLLIKVKACTQVTNRELALSTKPNGHNHEWIIERSWQSKFTEVKQLCLILSCFLR